MSKTLKDLCFLTGVLLPPLALVLYFFVKDVDYKKAFLHSTFYGVILWVVLGVVFGMNMCEPTTQGV